MNINRSEYYSDTIIPKHQLQMARFIDHHSFSGFVSSPCYFSRVISNTVASHTPVIPNGKPDKRRQSRPRNWWLVGLQPVDPKIVDHLNHLDPNPQANRGLMIWRLVGGFFTNPFEKYAQVKLGSSSPNRGENKKDLKPPRRAVEGLIFWVEIMEHLGNLCAFLGWRYDNVYGYKYTVSMIILYSHIILHVFLGWLSLSLSSIEYTFDAINKHALSSYALATILFPWKQLSQEECGFQNIFAHLISHVYFHVKRRVTLGGPTAFLDFCWMSFKIRDPQGPHPNSPNYVVS